MRQSQPWRQIYYSDGERFYVLKGLLVYWSLRYGARSSTSVQDADKTTWTSSPTPFLLWHHQARALLTSRGIVSLPPPHPTLDHIINFDHHTTCPPKVDFANAPQRCPMSSLRAPANPHEIRCQPILVLSPSRQRSPSDSQTRSLNQSRPELEERSTHYVQLLRDLEWHWCEQCLDPCYIGDRLAGCCEGCADDE